LRVSPPKALPVSHSKFQAPVISIKNIRTVGSMVQMVDTCLASMKASAQKSVPEIK
jgi:hypothetical protein